MTSLQKPWLTVGGPEQHQEDEQILGNREGYGKMGEGSPGISAPLRLRGSILCFKNLKVSISNLEQNENKACHPLNL